MANISKLQIEVEVTSHADEFFNTYRAKAHIVPKTSSENVHGVEIHEGDFGSAGAVKTWTFNLGNMENSDYKRKIEVDEENKTITSTAIEGDVLNLYKSFIVILQIIPNGEGSLVRWTWEYEKVDDDVPDPKKFQDLAANLTKDVDSYVVKNG
ncbi:hypothetical protein K2173_011762 [Erythroxylum novogranatense]|uniref:Bet v I/Major latex protein domain-containing protein n=1 Tax=Erythroxylum novogranatense TaxID=1862640 RepID=A0AAV8TTE0_9ROSI|nr:hypothetical protein K2173_011762 [Erythroxylum novogranatense]